MKRESFLIGFALLLLLLASGTNALAQNQTDQERAIEQARKGLRAREIPEATLPCTPEEANWWKELRAAGQAVNQPKIGLRQREKFARLVRNGWERSYRVPTPDRSFTILWRYPPDYTEEARRKKIKGSVAMAVELRPDGTVGEVKVVQGLDPGLDEMSVIAARRLVFLPPVKDRKFVSFWMAMTMSFDIY